jgi:predicted nucleotidyltransferase
MPVRSLSSSVLKWPNLAEVQQSLHAWLPTAAAHHPELVRFGYFGSYARGDWGVGSDLDLVAIIAETNEPFERRALTWDLSGLPVPAELLVYTAAEWRRMQAEAGRFARTLAGEAVWLYPPAPE